MPTLLIRHKVADYAIWKPDFDGRIVDRHAHGCQSSRIFLNAADPNETLILLEWDDLDRARLFAQSDDLRDAMTLSGVADEPDLWLLEEADGPP